VGAEDRVRPSARTVTAVRRAGVALVAVVVLAGVAAVAVSSDRIADSVENRLDTFASDASVENTQTGARLSQVTADKRYDYWKVAWEGFRDQPVAGIGAAGYEPLYTREKAYDKHSRFVHLIWLRALTETGVIGLALLGGAVLALWVGLVRVRRRTAGAAAAAALSFAFFLQCGLDWLEELPALLAPAVCLPLAVLRASRDCDGRPSWWRTTPAAVLAVVALLALAPSYLAVRHLARGDELRATDPQAALAAYDRAASADPLALTPHLRTGFFGLRLRDPALARRGFREALEVQDNWVSHFELGLLASQSGDRETALAELTRAAELNANDPIVDDAVISVRGGDTLHPLAWSRRVLEGDPLFANP
jgi:O-antigen ligase